MISYNHFAQLELKVAKILAAERVAGSEKLLRLEVDTGSERRQIVAGIGKAYAPEALIGREIVVLANLKPRTFTLRQNSGQVELESQGMLLAADSSEGPVLLVPEKETLPGAAIK